MEFWEGDMVLSVAKRVPAGLHVYHTLDGKINKEHNSFYVTS